jgi:hypothetical protein
MSADLAPFGPPPLGKLRSTLTILLDIGYFCRAMFRFILTIRLLVPISLTVLVVSHCCGDGPAVPGAPLAANCLLLANGEVVVGEIHIQRDQFDILTAEGISWKVPQRNVLYRGRDLKDVYAFLSQRLQPNEIRDQLELAEWCLAHSLYSECASHVIRARQLSPRDQRADSLETRLRLATTTPTKPSSQTTVVRSTTTRSDRHARTPRRAKQPTKAPTARAPTARAPTARAPTAGVNVPASDPFAPEIFNDKYSPRRSAPATHPEPGISLRGTTSG